MPLHIKQGRRLPGRPCPAASNKPACRHRSPGYIDLDAYPRRRRCIRRRGAGVYHTRVVSVWCPHGVCVVPAWCPRGSRGLRGVRVVPAWCPRGARVPPAWCPRCVHVVTNLNRRQCSRRGMSGYIHAIPGAATEVRQSRQMLPPACSR